MPPAVHAASTGDSAKGPRPRTPDLKAIVKQCVDLAGGRHKPARDLLVDRAREDDALFRLIVSNYLSNACYDLVQTEIQERNNRLRLTLEARAREASASATARPAAPRPSKGKSGGKFTYNAAMEAATKRSIAYVERAGDLTILGYGKIRDMTFAQIREALPILASNAKTAAGTYRFVRGVHDSAPDANPETAVHDVLNEDRLDAIQQEATDVTFS